MSNMPRVGTKEYKTYIGNRDGWICGICRSAVDPELSVYESIWAAVVDHVIPRFRGGTHDESNLQIAHYECNRLKGQLADNPYTRPKKQITCRACETVHPTDAAYRSIWTCTCGGQRRVPYPAGLRIGGFSGKKSGQKKARHDFSCRACLLITTDG